MIKEDIKAIEKKLFVISKAEILKILLIKRLDNLIRNRKQSLEEIAIGVTIDLQRLKDIFHKFEDITFLELSELTISLGIIMHNLVSDFNNYYDRLIIFLMRFHFSREEIADIIFNNYQEKLIDIIDDFDNLQSEKDELAKTIDELQLKLKKKRKSARKTRVPERPRKTEVAKKDEASRSHKKK